MPTYHSPSSSPSRSPRSSSFSPSPRRNRSRSRRRRSPTPSSGSPTYSSASRSPSPARHRSKSRSTRSKIRDKFPDDGLSEAKSESIVKTSLVFLGAVGAATLAAHKFWPKGVTYGEKEEWECEQKRKVRRAVREAEGRDNARDDDKGRGGRSRGRGEDGVPGGAGAYAPSSASSGSNGPGPGDDDGRRRRRRGGSPDGGRVEDRNGGRLDERNGERGGGGYYSREEVVVRDKMPPDLGRSRSRPAARDGDRDYRGAADRYDAAPVERHTSRTREVEYYPPSPPRVVAASRDRARSVVYDDEPEVVYVRREPAAGGGRYSVSSGSAVDARPRSRYGDDYYR